MALPARRAMPCADSLDAHAHGAHAEMRAALAASEPVSSVLSRAAWRALGGGLAGAAGTAAALALITPLRTVTTVQMSRGGGAASVAAALLREGGVRRLYRGAGVLAVQVPLARFGDTAANAGALAALGSLPATAGWPVAAQTAVSAVMAAAFRMVLTPLDALKVAAQTDGAAGWARLRAAARARGPRALFDGAQATAANALVGHWAYFGTFNTLLANVPAGGAGPLKRALADAGMAPGAAALVERSLRNAGIGLTAVLAADAATNSIRVIKTMRMTTGESYSQCVIAVIKADGLHGLFFRGFAARLWGNGLAGLINGITWRYLDSAWVAREGDGLSHAVLAAEAPPRPRT